MNIEFQEILCMKQIQGHIPRCDLCGGWFDLLTVSPHYEQKKQTQPSSQRVGYTCDTIEYHSILKVAYSFFEKK